MLGGLSFISAKGLMRNDGIDLRVHQLQVETDWEGEWESATGSGHWSVDRVQETQVEVWHLGPNLIPTT